MQLDVVDLRQFYESRLGLIVTRLLRGRIREIWPDAAACRVAGCGYAVPYLRPLIEGAERTVAFMPAAQGVHRWPPGEAGLVALVDETDLPVADASIDRLLVAHALENSEELRPMLREFWRVLAPEGRLLVLVPNRAGLWARFERTPFGHGHPYSPPQLNRLLRESLFSPIRTLPALYFPPSRSAVWLRAAPAIERLGARLGWWAFAGALLIEVGKQVYSPTGLIKVSARERRRRALATSPAAVRFERERERR
ncbi:MAG: class I SAM-dependent methyltransferase [Alphaproteobacteria bacterium]|nr:class I SAM-dependent methyltransferase [Alphaproteobacteria bacterium]